MKKILQKLPRVTRNSVLRTVAGFLGFLLIAAIIMLVLESTYGESGINSFFQSLWFSIVTVTTVGYGDLSPISKIGKIAAVVIMFIGVAYVGVVTGNITSWLVEKNRKRTFGLVPIKELKGHILICGWKQGMNEVLKGILELNNKEAREIVLVNDVEAQEVNELRQDPALRDFQYFSGDYTNSEVLLNSCVEHAEKALVIADEFSGKPVNETDFQTVLAAIAIKRLNPEVYTTVEIVDTGFQHYLQNVETEEILLNRFYARSMLCNMMLMSGVNSILGSFFSLNQGVLKIQPLDSRFIGKTYFDVKHGSPDSYVIGVMENTGKLRYRKREKMIQIQKSVTIKDAIGGLMEIKNMESNIAYLNPAPNYIIKENSALIVLDVNPNGLNGKHPIEESQDKNRIDFRYAAVVKQIEKGLVRSANWTEFCGRLTTNGIETYQFQGQVKGIIYKGKNLAFEELGVKDLLVKQINQLQRNRKEIDHLIAEKIESLLQESSSWKAFYEALNTAEMRTYKYRKKPYGIKYHNQNYSFKRLGLSENLIAQLEQHDGYLADGSGSGRVGKTIRANRGDGLIDYRKKHNSHLMLRDKAEPGKKGLLVICGWKPQLIEMLAFVIGHHTEHEPTWNRVVVVSAATKAEQKEFEASFGETENVELVIGDFVDQKTLHKAGIAEAKKVIILAETGSGKSSEEIDSQTVLTAMLVGSMNKQAYKIAEILDRRYKDALDRADVEEIFLEDEFLRIMLANGTRGTGITRVLGQLFNLDRTLIEISDIDNRFVHQRFYDLYEETYSPGKVILGLLEETGNIYARKAERIQKAQIQSNIVGQVEELIKVKCLVPNKLILAPTHDYRINPNTKLVVLKSNHAESWRGFKEMVT